MPNNNNKNIATYGLIAVAIAGGFMLLKKGKNLFSGAVLKFMLIGLRLHGFDKGVFKFASKLRLFNPSNTPVTVQVNSVIAYLNDKQLAISEPQKKASSIHANSTKDIETMFQVSYSTLISSGLSKYIGKLSELKEKLYFKITLTINGERVTVKQNISKEPDQMNGIGQLGIVSGPRNTQNGSKYNHLIAPSSGENMYLHKGEVDDVVNACVHIVASHYQEVMPLAKSLKKDNLKETCKNIFNFAYNFLQYKLDSPGVEELRTPARSWQDGQIRFKQQGDETAGIDCDDFSIFCGSILKCLDIPFKFRITKYNGRSYYQHIYVFVDDPNSDDEIIIDPVLSKFDYEKPYSKEKSTFNTRPIALAGLSGFDGLGGVSALGMPIMMLSGVNDSQDEDVVGVLSGIDFDHAVSGMGNFDQGIYNHIVRTRNAIKANPENISTVKDPALYLKMLNTAINNWNTPNREPIIDRLADMEDEMIRAGKIVYDESISGVEDEFGGFFRRIGKGLKKKLKVVRKGAKKAAVSAGKAIVRFNPVSIAIRNGLLLALRLNVGGLSKKLQYAYLRPEMYAKYNVDPAKAKRLRRVLSRIKRMFKAMQGKEANLKKAILKGAKTKSKGDFALGLVASASSVAAASGVIATIKKWLKPVGDIFKAVKQKRAVRSIKRSTERVQRLQDKYPEIKQVVAPTISPAVAPYYESNATNQILVDAGLKKSQYQKDNSVSAQRSVVPTGSRVPRNTAPQPQSTRYKEGNLIDQTLVDLGLKKSIHQKGSSTVLLPSDAPTGNRAIYNTGLQHKKSFWEKNGKNILFAGGAVLLTAGAMKVANNLNDKKKVHKSTRPKQAKKKQSKESLQGNIELK